MDRPSLALRVRIWTAAAAVPQYFGTAGDQRTADFGRPGAKNGKIVEIRIRFLSHFTLFPVTLNVVAGGRYRAIEVALWLWRQGQSLRKWNCQGVFDQGVLTSAIASS